MKKNEIYRSQFRLPYDLYEKLKAAADKNHTSVNAELVDRLARTFDDSQRELRALNNKLVAAELEGLINEATLIAGMLSLLTNLKADVPESEITRIRETLTERLKAMGDLQQRTKELTDRLRAE